MDTKSKSKVVKSCVYLSYMITNQLEANSPMFIVIRIYFHLQIDTIKEADVMVDKLWSSSK